MQKPMILLTQSAQEHFKRLVKDDKMISLKLKSSGCSGYSYVLDIEEKSDNGCEIIQQIPFKILPEHMSAFDNMVIDYKREGMNTKVVFDNPNVINACGCGESFGLKL